MQELVARDGARVRRPRHPRRLRRPRDERAGDRDDARGMGAQLRRARPRLLPRRARGVPRADRAGHAAARSCSSRSKNALVAGANAAAYSSAKAASLHLARCLAEEGGPHGIRVNTVNPDAVIQGSGIWSSDWKAERASTYGVTEDDLQSFYRDAHEARRQRLPGGRRRGDRVPRRAAIGEVDRKRHQRRRRRHRRVSAMTRAAAPRRAARSLEELRRRPGARRTSASRSSPARCTRSSARTAPASRRS